MGSRFTTTQPVLEANGKQTKAVVLFVYEGGGLEATSKIASIHWDSAQKYLLVLFVFKCTTQGSRRCKKDCLNDETYQPQFLAGLPLAQWGSLPHALFGSCPLLLWRYHTSNPAHHIPLLPSLLPKVSKIPCRWASTTGTKAARTTSCTRGTRSTSRQMTGGQKRSQMIAWTNFSTTYVLVTWTYFSTTYLLHRPFIFDRYQAHRSTDGHKQPFDGDWEAGEEVQQ